MSSPANSTVPPTPAPSSPNLPPSDSWGNDPREDGHGETAPYPFDNMYKDADVVLQASDGTRFYVHKSTLRVASKFFSSMFSLPQPPSPSSAVGSSDAREEIPSIPVTEDSATLERLLRMCYPIDSPDNSDSSIQAVAPILGAALKYQMPMVAKLMAKSLLNHCTFDPLGVFAVAYKLDLQKYEARAVHEFTKWCTRTKPTHSGKGPGRNAAGIPDITSSRAHSLGEYSSELNSLPASVYYRLLEYHTTTTVTSSLQNAEAAVKHICSRSHNFPEILHEADVLVGRLAHPFRDTTRADTIVHSSDNFEFHLSRNLLSFASPVFARLFPVSSTATASDSLGASQTGSAVQTPHRFPEDGLTLSRLFQLSYPMPDPELSGDGSPDVERRSALSLLEAAKKYEVARALSFAKQACVQAARASPVQLYLLAMQYNWNDVAQEAAMRAVYETSDKYVPELETASTAAYRRLLVYRQKCRDVILNGGQSESPQGTPSTPPRSAYWSKSSWLHSPAEAKFWLAFHHRVSSNTVTAENVVMLPMDVEEYLPTSVLLERTGMDYPRRGGSSTLAPPTCPATTEPGDGRQVELERIGGALVKVRACLR
ncbi:hypothetical protein EVJ58_g1216 [Rhodofomes roseus]|uniref:BTB domain-containing protein n=1 Tax=Rhodofomes roseus TaxID=34475 RepID=A0A4Y9Z0Q6_9APHY|nr:hypothetical protein EVJ58_g1216 [Rhodofomes roseus]